MDRRNMPKTHDEVMMEQVLSEFQKLLLSGSEEKTDQQQPQKDAEQVSEYDMIDPEVAAAELIHVLRNLPWRQNLEDEDLPCVWDYFHLTMQIMEDLHREHSQPKTNSRKKNNQAQAQARQRSHDQWEPLSDSRPTSLDYLFQCSMCCDVFSMLCDHFGSNLPSSTRESQCTRIVEIIELPNDPNEPSTSEMEGSVEPLLAFKVEPQPAFKVEPQPPFKVEPQPPFRVEPQPPFKVEPKPAFKVESQPPFKVEPQPAFKVEPQPPFKVEPQPAFQVEPQPPFKVEPQPAFKVEPQPPFKVEPQPAFQVEPQPAFKVEPHIIIRPQRRSLSPIPNLPSTSRQYHFADPEPPRKIEGRVSTSPVPNLPSTSKGYNFTYDAQACPTPGPSSHYKGSQMRAVSEPPLFSIESKAERERKKKLERIKKEKNLYHRKGKK